MTNNRKIKLSVEFVKKHNTGYDSGHDWWHIERVKRLSLFINSKEKLADPFILEIASLLHDVADSKFCKGNQAELYSEIAEFLDKNEMADIRDRILEIIGNVSFSNQKLKGNLNDPVLLIIQDADKLDAMGAIGIARAFNYGGFRNNPIYAPGGKGFNENKTTIGHFYDKLLKLKDMMNTSTGRMLAEERHLFLVSFLEQFYKEWDFVK